MFDTPPPPPPAPPHGGNDGDSFPNIPCIQKVYGNKKASVHWSAARNKENFSFRCLTSRSSLVNRGFVSTFGLNKISLVRDSDGTFLQFVPYALKNTKDACFLVEHFCRRSVLTDPIPSPRCAFRIDAPVICSDLDSTVFLHTILKCCARSRSAGSTN